MLSEVQRVPPERASLCVPLFLFRIDRLAPIAKFTESVIKERSTNQFTCVYCGQFCAVVLRDVTEPPTKPLTAAQLDVTNTEKPRTWLLCDNAIEPEHSQGRWQDYDAGTDPTE